MNQEQINNLVNSLTSFMALALGVGMARGMIPGPAAAPLSFLPKTKKGLVYVPPEQVNKGDIIQAKHGKAKVVAVERWEDIEDTLKREMSPDELQNLKVRIRTFLGDESRYYEVWIQYVEEPRDYDTLDWSEYGSLSKGGR